MIGDWLWNHALTILIVLALAAILSPFLTVIFLVRYEAGQRRRYQANLQRRQKASWIARPPGTP